MIKDFRLKELGYDFMGYEFTNPNQLSFHHLIVPHRECSKKNIEHDGYVYWNGAILRQNTSHDYLHTIEKYDYDKFLALTSELIDINVQRKIYIENLRYINDILKGFEREYSGKRHKNGQEIIKPEYERRIIR